jgi:HK97 family phage portal protein
MAFGLGRRQEARAIQSTPWGVWPGDEYGPTWAGASVDARSSLQLLTVYGCVRLITDSIATLPLGVFRKVDGTPKAETVPAWLVTPTVGLSRTAWMTQVLSSLLLHGNAYIGVKRNDQGSLIELVVLDPCRVQVDREGGALVVHVDGRTVPYQVLHIPGLMLPGADVGFSPVEAARQSIGMGMAAQEYGARFFGQGATLAGVIEVPGELPPGKPKEMAQMWRRRHAGKTKAHLPGVLEGGAKWVSTGVTNEQAQFLETRGFTAAEIAGQMFLLDPSDLGIPMPSGPNQTYANLEQRNLRRVQVALLPWIVRVEEALSGLLPQPRYVKLNVAGLLRADLKTRFESYAIGISNKFMVPNQARAFEEWEPLPGGDKVADIPKPAAPSAAPAPQGGPHA